VQYEDGVFLAFAPSSGFKYSNYTGPYRHGELTFLCF
jgi:hypothetical protein